MRHATLDSLTAQQALQIDALCVELEQAWRAGESPRIEELLEQAPQALRDQLLFELLAVELALRREMGHDPLEMGSCQERFPGFEEVVRRAIAESRDHHDATTLGNSPSPHCQAEGERISLTLPRPFGQYELLEEIARGGMGVVYKARQRGLNRSVALKMILTGNLASWEEVRRFEGEAQAAANLRHPGIVPVYEVGQCDGRHFYSMGLVEGENLAKRVRRGPLEPREAVRLIKGIAEAVAHAHRCGVIHRDLKPSNVLLDEAGRPFVADFGLAKCLERGGGLTHTGQMVGTPGYMSPEQARGAADVGSAADVYSLGAILYCLLTGRPPFQAANSFETVKQVLESEPASPRRLNPAIDRDLDTICLKCLEKNPAHRYTTADELVQELGCYLNGEPIRARRIGPVMRAARWCRRKPLPATLMAVSAVALAASIVLQVRLMATHELAETRGYYSALGNARQEMEDRTTGWTLPAMEHLDTAAKLRSAEGDPKELRSQAARVLAAWDLRPMGELAEFNVGAMAFSPDGKRLAVAELLNDERLTISVYDPGTRELVSQFGVDVVADRAEYVRREEQGEKIRTSPAFYSVKFSPDGRWLAAGTRLGKIYCWDTGSPSAEPVAAWQAHEREIYCLAFAPNGALLYSVCNFSGPIRVWLIPSGEMIAELAGNHNYISLSPDGKWIASGRGRLSVWGATDFAKTPVSNVEVSHLGYSASGTLLAAGKAQSVLGNYLSLLKMPGGAVVRELRDLSAPDANVDDNPCFAANDQLLISSCSDERVRLWDVLSGTLVAQALAPGRAYPIAAIEPKGRFLAVAGAFGATVYEIRHPDACTVRTIQDDDLAAIEFEPGSRVLAAISESRHEGTIVTSRLQFWDDEGSIGCQTRVSTRPGSRDTFEPIVPSLAFAANGNVVWGSSQARLQCRRIEGIPQSAYSFDTGPLGGAVLEENAFVSASNGARCEVRPDLLAANGKAMRLPRLGEIVVRLNQADLDALHPAFACYAVVRVEGERGAEVVFEHQGYKDEKAWKTSKLRGVDAPSTGYHLYQVAYETRPSDGQPKLDVHIRAQDASGLEAIWVDRLIFVPVAVPADNGPPRVFPKLAETGPYAWSPDGRRLWGIEDETKIHCWAAPTMQPLFEIKNPLTGLDHNDNILRSMVCNNDVVLVGARHGEVFLFSARDGRLQKTVLLPDSAVRTVALDPSGKLAVAGTDQGGLFLVNTSDGQLLGQLPEHRAGVRSVLFSRDGQLLVTGSQDRSVRFWGCSGSSFVELFRLDKLPGPVKAVRLSDDKCRLAVLLEKERGVRIWKLDELNERFRKLNVTVRELENDDRIVPVHGKSSVEKLENHAQTTQDQRHGMEERKQVGITAVLNGDKHLQILGTENADTIEVRQYYGQIVVPGIMIQVDGSLRWSVPESRVHEINVWGYGGDDKIKIFDSTDGAPCQDMEHKARIWGGPGDDVLIGGYSNDNLYGEGGQDTLDGRRSNDWLSGGGEDDKLTGGPHQDWLFGDNDYDVLTDDAGNEYLIDSIEAR